MTKAQYTPGPWQLPTGYERLHPCEHEGMPVFVDGDPFDTIAMIMPREDGNANARLIAAAPDGLEFAMSYLEWDKEAISPLAAQARAFIAKAVGKRI